MRQVVLGTVQIGVPYGALRNSPLMPEAAACAILEEAWSMGIRAFDTAEAYGASPGRLRRWLGDAGRLGEASVVTKVVVPDGADVESLVHPAVERFAGAASLTVLAHGGVAADRWPEFREAVRDGNASPGQSLYTEEELRAALRCDGIVRVQAPANALDLRALSTRGEAPVSLDLRSLFLQGVLLATPEEAERRVVGGGALARAVARGARAAEADAAPLLIAAVLRRLLDGDRVVIGADAPGQLAPFRSGVALAKMDEGRVICFEEAVTAALSGAVGPRLLDPRQWP